MKCPRCRRPVDHEADSCYSCGYSEIEAAVKFGSNLVRMTRIHDAAHCLRKAEKDALAETFAQLETKFPQLLFCAYLGTLPEGLSLSELGFWLLNHGQVEGAEYARNNENAILAVVDLNSRQIGISMGYYAEVLVSDENAYRAMMHARPHLMNAEYGEALVRLFMRLGVLLGKRARKLRKMTEAEVAIELAPKGFTRLANPLHQRARKESLETSAPEKAERKDRETSKDAVEGTEEFDEVELEEAC